MKHELMQLPYKLNALEPFMSEETVEYHYGKHHLAYVNKLNELQEGTEFADMSLEEVITRASGGIFNNAAQIWNHNLFWNTFNPHPNPGSAPANARVLLTGERTSSKLAKMIAESFGSFENMKETFKAEALGRFGSGWVWLVQKGESLDIYSTSNAENPLTLWGTALLGCDVWEHAYYIDTRNDRARYIENFWNIIDWEIVASRLA